MAKEFVMGARINMSDGFSSPVSHMTEATMQFSNATHQGDRAVSSLGRSAATSTAGLGAFTAGSRAATMSVRGLAGGLATLSTSMLGVSNIMGAVMGVMTFTAAYKWLVGSNAQMEQYENTLTVVLKSSERAKETLEWATTFAAQTPFEIPQVVEATTRLETYGLTAQKTLGTIGDMASVMGKPLMQAVEAVADAQTGELERLKEFGITKDMLAAQAEKMGTTAVNNKGQITDQQAFNAALFTLMEDRYKGGMEMQSKTFKGMLSNVADFIGTMGRDFGQPIFERMRAGLANALGFLDTIKNNGTMEAITAKAQAFGNAVANVFSFGFGTVGRILGLITEKAGIFLGNNATRFQTIAASMGIGFSQMSNVAMPILNWIIDAALPKMLDALVIVGGWVVAVAEFFAVNWAHIAPFIEGIGIALGTYFITQLEVAALRIQAITAITKVWTAAQAMFNAVMMVNPIYLVIAAIGLLIGAGIWLVQNWELVSNTAANVWASITSGISNLWAKFSAFAANAAAAVISVLYFFNPFVYLAVNIARNWATLGTVFRDIWTSITSPIVNVVNTIIGGFSATWDYLVGFGTGILAFFATTWQLVVASVAAYFGPVIAAISSIGQGIADYFGNLATQAFTWGANIIDTMITGVLSAKDRIVGAFTQVFGEVRQLMPFSDAKEGPFSQLTYSGGAIISTMAEGVEAKAGMLHQAMGTAFSQASELTPSFGEMTAPVMPMAQQLAPMAPMTQVIPLAPLMPMTQQMPPMAQQLAPLAPAMLQQAVPGNFSAEPVTSAVTAANIPISASPATSTNSRSLQIDTLIGRLEISGVDKNARQLAEEVIDIIHEKLKGANDIISADMGGLL